MSAQYAATTSVSSEQSRNEIERTLRRYGADDFAYATNRERAMIGFAANDRQVRFILPMPDPQAKEFTHTPATKKLRSAAEAEKAFEQAVRQKWRALALMVKAKLEAVEAGIVTFEQEFATHMVLSDGRSVMDHIAPAIAENYASGRVRPLLEVTS